MLDVCLMAFHSSSPPEESSSVNITRRSSMRVPVCAPPI